jgi:hypothetical protein
MTDNLHIKRANSVNFQFSNVFPSVGEMVYKFWYRVSVRTGGWETLIHMNCIENYYKLQRACFVFQIFGHNCLTIFAKQWLARV